MIALTESSTHPREVLTEKYLSVTAHRHKPAELRLHGASYNVLLHSGVSFRMRVKQRRERCLPIFRYFSTQK